MADGASSYDAARYKRSGRGKIYDSILDTIGDTPLIRLPRLSAEIKPKGEVVAKLEFFNPLASVKDRIGVSLIESLEAQGLLTPGATIVEPTSGNTGIALAFVLSRVLFGICYIGDWASARSLVWFFGMGCIVALFVGVAG